MSRGAGGGRSQTKEQAGLQDPSKRRGDRQDELRRPRRGRRLTFLAGRTAQKSWTSWAAPAPPARGVLPGSSRRSVVP